MTYMAIAIIIMNSEMPFTNHPLSIFIFPEKDTEFHHTPLQRWNIGCKIFSLNPVIKFLPQPSTLNKQKKCFILQFASFYKFVSKVMVFDPVIMIIMITMLMMIIIKILKGRLLRRGRRRRGRWRRRRGTRKRKEQEEEKEKK